jgi:peptidoglycan/xylan/chitin deacetylase (PgdA/CDA1 family)
MNLRAIAVPCASSVLAFLSTACGGDHPSRGDTGQANREDTGQAVAALGPVPPLVGCVEVDVAGSSTVVTRSDVTQGQSPVLSLVGLPLGNDSFSAFAYPSACKSVTGQAQATWISDAVPAAVSATSVASVSLTLQPNGRASVGVGFNTGDAGADGSTGPALTGNGCAGGACLNPSCSPLGTPVPIDPSPNTGFDAQPAFIPNDVIILTLDDGPDSADTPPDPLFGAGAWTKADLQYLDANAIHLDFFMNTDNWCGDLSLPSADPACNAAIADILTLHNPGNHTVHHIHMGANIAPDTSFNPPLPQSCDGASSQDSCDAEITGVESITSALSNGGRPHLTRFRPPYGEPFLVSGPGLADVSAVVAKHAVWVGWNVDSGDSVFNTTNCAMSPCPTGQQVAGTVESLIGSGPGQGGRWGIVLMHSTYPWTHDALPILLGPNGYLATHKFRLGTVEDAICWKYGKHSWEIVQQLSGQPFGPN